MSANDISAIWLSDTEEGEIFEDDQDIIFVKDNNNNNPHFFDILKRSFDKRNSLSQNGSSLSLDETFGGRSDNNNNNGNNGNKNDNNNVNKKSSEALSKDLKELNELKELRDELNVSFTAFEEKLTKLEDSVIIEDESPDSSFLRDIARERVRQVRKEDTPPPPKRDETSKPAFVRRPLDEEDRRRSASRKNRERTSTSTASPLFKSVFSLPLAAPPSSSSTPKRERVYSQRPAVSRPKLVDVKAKENVSAWIRSGSPQTSGRRAKRAMSPSEDDERRTKRGRWESDDVRVVKMINPVQGRPVRPRIRTVSQGPAFRSPRDRASAHAHVRARTTGGAGAEQTTEYNRQEMLAKMIDEKYDQVIFVDLDNWVNFFGHLTSHLPSKAFVWGFWGQQTNWFPPRGNRFYNELLATNRFEETMAGRDKDAADFAIVLKIGQMDKDIKNRDIGFTIVTGDRGFNQVKMDFLGTKRQIEIVNPHKLNRNRGQFGNGDNIDAALRRHCRRSRSTEPIVRSPIAFSQILSYSLSFCFNKMFGLSPSFLWNGFKRLWHRQ